MKVAAALSFKLMEKSVHDYMIHTICLWPWMHNKTCSQTYIRGIHFKQCWGGEKIYLVFSSKNGRYGIFFTAFL